MPPLDQFPPSQTPAPRAGGCPSDLEMLALWRGELSDEQSHAIQTHFTVCQTCASRSDRFRNVADSSVSNQGAVTVSISPVPASPARGAALAGAGPRAAESLPRIPRQLGPYRLISLLGRGGMGMVFKASHTRLKRLAAVKVLPPSLIEDAYQADRLHREIEAAGAVRHPNVVFATDAGEDQGIVYLVMEYVAGIDLGRLIAQHGPLAVADACEITRQAAEGLAHLHHRHLIHRDLKPTNLMLASDGTVKILDLGLARFLTARQGDKELTDREDVLGTADYMAPEQAASPREVDARSDIYSLGCTLFKLLIGRAPFSDDEHTSFGAKILAHQQSAPPRLDSLRKDIPAGLAAVVERMLAKSQEARFQTADEVVQALQPWCGGANLVPLVPESLAETQDLSPDDMPWLARTPSPAGASPHGKSSSPAAPPSPQPRPARFPPWARWLAVACGLASLLLISGAIFLRVLEPEPEYREISWPGGGRGRHGLQYDSVRGILHAHSEQRQFIRIGSYAAQTGKLGVTIDQASVGWPGDAGIFLGYREVPFRDGYAARAQIIRLARMDIQLGKSPPRLMVCREVMTLEPNTGTREDMVECFALIPWPNTQPIRLEVELANGRVTGILANGQRLDTLVAAEVNEAMPPVETAGQAGVFHRGPAGTWFSELSFELLQP